MAIAPFLQQLRARFKYRHFERDLAEEIATHRALAEAALLADGTDHRRVRRQAARLLGNTTIAREDGRAMWIPTMLQQLIQDARYAWRGMRREPGFHVAAIAMLTIGLGLVAGGYTVVNGLLFRGWALPDNAQVFTASARRASTPAAGVVSDGFSSGAYRHIRASAKTSDYVAMTIQYFRVRPDGTSTGILTPGAFVSDNFVGTLGIALQRGTGFSVASAAAQPRILISDGVWRRIFGADPGIVGRTAWLGDVPATIVGITAREFDGLGPQRLDVIVEASVASQFSSPASQRFTNETLCCVLVAGRLRDGVSRTQAREELQGLTAQYRQSTRQPELTVTVARTVPWEGLGQSGQGPLLEILLALIGAGFLLVFLLTCANVGNLYLARSLRRTREIAVRLSLGASRARVVRQLLTEGLAMASMAGAGAFLVTTGVPFALYLIEDNFTASMFASDWRVAAFTAAAVMATCLLVSLAPALQTTRIAWRGATTTMSARTGRTRRVLLAGQIAIAAVLVLSATLVGRGIQHAVSVPADFALETTSAVTLVAPLGQTFDVKQSAGLHAALARAIQQSGMLLGVASMAPLSRQAGFGTSVRHPSSETAFNVRLLPLSASALTILDVKLINGRMASDDVAAGEAVVNATLARQMWPNENAVGRAFKLDFNKRTYAVVGVTRDAHLTALDEVEPMVHVPLSLGVPVLLARTEPALPQRMKALVASVDPALTVTVTPLSAGVKETLENAILGASIAGGLGVLALLLAIVGVFGVFSYLVEERRREIGIRLALGASRRQIRLALFRASRGAVVGGLVAGLILSAIVGTALRRFLFGLSPADPLSYAVVALLLVAAALIATALPIRRALRVDPAVTLKAE